MTAFMRRGTMKNAYKTKRKLALAAILTSTCILAGCFGREFEKHETPIPGATLNLMAEKGVDQSDDVFMRIFKKEAELEVWKKASSGKFIHLKTYEICAWSGELGPKFKEGDRQAPEGFYKVSSGLMNPNSSFHLSFNLGFPNAYDRSHDRTGSFLMVHGACSSAGCYSMEDHQIEEIFAIAREAFRGGQKKFQVQAFPFRMTPENMALFRDNKHMPFWRVLKRGYEHFELTRAEPKVDACNRGYVFNAEAKDGGIFDAQNACPDYEINAEILPLVEQKISQDRTIEDQIAAGFTSSKERKHAELVALLKMEQERGDRFTDRGLAFSSHLKRRVIDIQKQLVALGYNKDGSVPEIQQGNAVPQAQDAQKS